MENHFEPKTDLIIESDRSQAKLDRIIEDCESLSVYQLNRLSCKILAMLEDPERINEVKRQFSPGDVIEYYLSDENRHITATLDKHNRTYASVTRLDDGSLWKIPYSWIKTSHDEFSNRSPASTLTRDDVSVGEFIGFRDRDNQQRYGTIVRLNRKTVSIDSEDGTKWRVGYSFLFRVLNGDAQEPSNQLKITPDQQWLIE